MVAVNAETIWLFLLIEGGLVFVLGFGRFVRRSRTADQSATAVQRDRALLIMALPVGLILWQGLAFSILFSAT